MSDPSARRWRRLMPAIIVLAALAMFADVLFSSKYILSLQGADLAQQFVGWRDFGFGEIRAGRFPLWNPHLFSGAPFFGGFQAALLYPPNWVHLIFPTPIAINLEIAINVLIAGLAMYFWARQRDLHPLAATLAGITYMFAGPFFLHIAAGHLANLAVMAWAPAVFLGIDAALSQQFRRALLLGSVAVAMQILGGHPQYVFYTFVTAAAYVVLNLIVMPPATPQLH